MAELISREAFKVIEGRPVTSSIKVAEYFDKPHNDVLKSIRRLIEAKADFSREGNFSLTEEIKQVGATTRKVPFYWMDRKGFSILAMGFTGAKALDFKCAFYDEFERMEQALRLAPSAAPAYITPEQGWQIQGAVQRRVHKDRVSFQTVYHALKAHFRIPKYTFLRVQDFDEALRFIATCELKVPVTQEPKATDDRCPCCGLSPIEPDSIVLSSREADQLLALIYCVRYQHADVFTKLYAFLRTTKSPLAPALWDAFRETPWRRMLDILARHGHDINDLPCYQAWKASRTA